MYPLTAALPDEFDQALERGERLGMEIKGVIDEQDHGFLRPPEQLLQIAFAPRSPTDLGGSGFSRPTAKQTIGP